MKRIMRSAALLLLVVLCLSLVACSGGGDKIVGTWCQKNSTNDVVIATYEFTKDGEFIIVVYTLLKNEGREDTKITGTYKVKGNELTMIYDDNTPDNKRVRTYKIKGDKLTITDPEEGPFEYIREIKNEENNLVETCEEKNDVDKLIGTWEEKIDDVVINSVEFTKNGEFKSYTKSLEMKMNGTYKVKGNELTLIHYTGDKERVYTFEIKGDKLTITDPERSNEFTRSQ